jgi:hypothetical protein
MGWDAGASRGQARESAAAPYSILEAHTTMSAYPSTWVEFHASDDSDAVKRRTTSGRIFPIAPASGLPTAASLATKGFVRCLRPGFGVNYRPMTSVSATRVLSDAQASAFDFEILDEELWSVLKPVLTQQLTGPSKHILDVGGGNGMFVDRVLEAFPTAEATLVEPAHNLVTANCPNPKKTVLQSTFQQVGLRDTKPVDVIFFNWVLHHFVVDSYKTTTRTQCDALILARQLLKPGGRLIVFEQLYNGSKIDDLPGRIIYELTSQRRLAPLTSRLGANTAGVGVCFHSEQGWRELFERAGLSVNSFTPCYAMGAMARWKRLALGLRETRVGMFELSARTGE